MPSRIMVVEDDLHIALLLQYNLEAAGYVVDHVDNGDDVEGRIAACVPDLVLLDWRLPGISGIELCRRIRRHASADRLPIVMLTARTDKADRDYATRVGANDFLTKPFQVSEVLATAGRYLRAVPGKAWAPA